tara:strand:- start:855 stop:1460 length:606 start_codon:yes stop_codon:yes gene_type:complete
MKTLFTLTTLLFLFTQTFLVAQISNTSDYLVISGDTLYGNIKHINENGANPKYYKKIRLTETNGNQKKHKKTDVSAFRVNGVNYEGFWLNQSSEKMVFINPRYDINPQNGERYFLREISKGKLSHYHLEWFEQGESRLMWMDLLKKEEDPFFIRATQGLFGLKKKVLINYFQNCPDLKEQIEQKQLNSVEQVVDFYNNYCL